MEMYRNDEALEPGEASHLLGPSEGLMRHKLCMWIPASWRNQKSCAKHLGVKDYWCRWTSMQDHQKASLSSETYSGRCSLRVLEELQTRGLRLQGDHL